MYRSIQSKPNHSAFSPIASNPSRSMFASRPFEEEADAEAHSQTDHAQSSIQAHPDSSSRPSVNFLTVPLHAPSSAYPGAVQAKLAIGQPGDKYEQEADRTASQVMRMPDPQTKSEPIVPPIAPPKLSVQAKGNGTEANQEIESQLSQSQGSGSRLPDSVRSFMEPRFGSSFENVRVHTDSNAVQMNQALGAQAFTHGSDIYYGAEKSPAVSDLTAHELTHVVQQTGTVQSKQISKPVQMKCSACRNEELGVQQPSQPASSKDENNLVQRTIENLPDTASSEGNLQSEGFAGDSELEAISRGQHRMMAPEQGSAVGKVQTRLNELGYSLPRFGIDEKFGSETGAAVVRFKQDNGINPSDPIVGQKTISALDKHLQDTSFPPSIFPSLPPIWAPPENGIQTVKVWLNAFIPGDVPGKTVPAPSPPGGTMLHGPIPSISDCFQTDNRAFDPAINAPSRMHSEVEIITTGDEPSISLQFHKCYPTHEIDCEDGQLECEKEGDVTRMNFSNLATLSESKFMFSINAAANNPCATGSPDIDYVGEITVDLAARTVSFSGFVDQFPAFEMYATSNGGAGATLFRAMPLPGKDPWNLFGGADRAQAGKAKI